MKKNKVVLLLLSISLSFIIFTFVFVNNVFASVDKIVFINEPQIIKVGEFSKQYQIQLQDASGLITTSADTTYFTLPLDIGMFYSKATGSEPFIASSSIYIATGSSNKYFYFKSNNIGEYVIKIYARDKNNTKQWETEQIVKVVDEILPELVDSNSTPKSTSTETKIVTKTVYISSHSGTEDLSNYDEKTTFEISAGRERMAIVGSPLGFDAKYNLPQNEQCTPTFKWSYGDGFEASGKVVEHTYKYSGEYQVVLNGTCGEYSASSRTIVKVTIPNIIISGLENGDAELLNNSKVEINIGGWKVKEGQNEFVFSKDTIISAGNKIVLSKEDLKNDNSINRISLNNPAGREVSFVDTKVLSQDIATSSNTSADRKIISIGDSYISVAEAEKLVKEYREKIASNGQQINNISTSSNKVSLIKEMNIITNNKDIIETATVAEAVKSTPTKGFWANLIDIPVNGIKSFAHIFYDF